MTRRATIRNRRRRRRAGAGLAAGALALLMGTAAFRGAEASAPPPPAPVLQAVVVQPSAEEVARREERKAREAEERARRDAIARAAEHFGIGEELAGRIHDAARDAGIEPRLAFGLVRVESRFDSTAVGPAGAVGLAQVMPATARGMDASVERSDLVRPDVNLRLGMGYLRGLLDRYDGDRRMALTAYNRGPGTVARACAAGQEPYNGYARRVLRNQPPAAR